MLVRSERAIEVQAFMPKHQTNQASDQALLAEVRSEMASPRVTESAHAELERQNQNRRFNPASSEKETRMPVEPVKTQDDERQDGQPGVSGETQNEKPSSQSRRGTNNQKNGKLGNPKTSHQGDPGPHGSSDPETAERNKNKPLLDDWGKGDKH
jgi:hypothetical protein